MPDTPNINIILIGFMGTGKSAVGRAYARKTGARHWDTDTEIEQMMGKPIPQIFLEDGEAAFRACETSLLATLALPNGPLAEVGTILSTGGGTPLRAENAALLKTLGTVVWIRASPEAILARVAHSLHVRPLLAAYADADPLERIQSLLAAREPHYASLADLVLETSDCLNCEEAADRLIQLAASNHLP